MTYSIEEFFGDQYNNGLIKLETHSLNIELNVGDDFRVGPFLLRCIATDSTFTYAVKIETERN